MYCSAKCCAQASFTGLRLTCMLQNILSRSRSTRYNVSHWHHSDVDTILDLCLSRGLLAKLEDKHGVPWRLDVTRQAMMPSNGSGDVRSPPRSGGSAFRYSGRNRLQSRLIPGMWPRGRLDGAQWRPWRDLVAGDAESLHNVKSGYVNA